MVINSDYNFYFNNIMNNHSNNNFFEKNTYLGKNLSRPTNDLSDILSFPEESFSILPSNEIPLKNKLFVPIDNSLIYFSNNNYGNINNNDNTNYNNKQSEI